MMDIIRRFRGKEKEIVPQVYCTRHGCRLEEHIIYGTTYYEPISGHGYRYNTTHMRCTYTYTKTDSYFWEGSRCEQGYTISKDVEELLGSIPSRCVPTIGDKDLDESYWWCYQHHLDTRTSEDAIQHGKMPNSTLQREHE